MRIYLVQHGQACAKQDDPERPLTARGETDIRRLTGFLDRAGIRVARVVHSGRLRARQTAALLAQRLAPGIRPEQVTFLNPGDDPAEHAWADEVGQGDLLAVGHLPHLDRLVAWLVCRDRPGLVGFEPGSIVCLESTPDEAWCIAWMIRPELLADA